MALRYSPITATPEWHILSPVTATPLVRILLICTETATWIWLLLKYLSPCAAQDEDSLIFAETCFFLVFTFSKFLSFHYNCIIVVSTHQPWDLFWQINTAQQSLTVIHSMKLQANPCRIDLPKIKPASSYSTAPHTTRTSSPKACNTPAGIPSWNVNPRHMSSIAASSLWYSQTRFQCRRMP